MSMSNIVVNDGKATPLAHTFIGIADGDNARYVNQDSLTLKGQETLGFTVKRSSGTQASTARVTHWDPVEVTVAGVTTVDHGNSCDLKWNFSPSATLAERTDTFMQSINAAIALKDSIVGLLPIL